MIVSILIVLLLLNILIIVHEFGHFIFAKWSKAHIQEFSIGFGPRIIKFKLMNTPSYIRLFPFGGYVSLIGETEDEGPGSFVRLNIAKQLLIILGGIFFNLVLAYVIFLILMLVKPKLYFPDIGVKPHFAEVNTNRPMLVVVKVQDDSDLKRYVKDSALPIGLLKLNNQNINDFKSLHNFLKKHKKGDSISVTYCNIEKYLQENDISKCYSNYKTVKVKLLNNSKLGVIVTELTSIDWDYKMYNFFLRPLLFFYDIGSITIEFMKQTLNVAISKHNYKVIEYTVGGPVSIIPIVSNIITNDKNVVFQLFFLLGLFSINLAFINALPFPGLDGWHVVLVFIRKLFPQLSINKFFRIITTLGLFVLFGLGIIITIKDIKLVFFSQYGK